MLANSDIRGNVKPQDLRLAINDVCQEIYDEYPFDLNRMTNRENRGLLNTGVENMADLIRQRMNYFLVEDATLTYAAPYFTLPTTLRWIESISYEPEDDSVDVELCKTKREFKAITNYIDTTPTATRPIALQVGSTLKVAPASIIANIKLSYLRNPLVPNWTYIVVDGNEVYNPSAGDHQDIDLHASEEHNIVIRTLNRFGINLKAEDITAVTMNKEAQDFNQENAN